MLFHQVNHPTFTNEYTTFVSVIREDCKRMGKICFCKLESKRFEMWCWRRMEKISWTDHVRNEEVLLRVKEQRNIVHKIRKRKANWIGHILRRNCLLQRVTEGKIQGGIEVSGRQGKKT
jgi:hypothetical protein